MKKRIAIKIDRVTVIVNTTTGRTAVLVLPVGMNGAQLKEWRRLTATPARAIWF